MSSPHKVQDQYAAIPIKKTGRRRKKRRRGEEKEEKGRAVRRKEGPLL